MKTLFSHFLDFPLARSSPLNVYGQKNTFRKTPNVYFICMCVISVMNIVIEQTYMLTNTMTMSATEDFGQVSVVKFDVFQRWLTDLAKGNKELTEKALVLNIIKKHK